MPNYLIICLAAAAMSVSSAHALEVTANGASVDGNMIGISNKVDTLQAALTAAMNLGFVCNNKGKVYASDASVAGRDSDGCISTGGGTFTPTDYEIAKTQVIEPHPSVQCDSTWCTATLSMAPYVGKDNVAVQARCEGSWCNMTGSVIIPDLTANWSGRVVVNGGSKRNGISATYNASTKIITFQTFYEGDSSNSKVCRLRDVVIKFIDLVIQPKATP